MGANDVQIQIIGRDMASGVFRQVNSAAQSTTKELNSLGSAMGTVNSVFRNAAGIAAGIAGLHGLESVFQSTIGSAIGFAKAMETNQVGMSGILMSMVQVGDRNLEWNEAMGISSNIMRQLNDEALRTAATSEELVNTYRGLLGPGLAAKMTVQEIVELTSTGVNAVKSLGLNNTQLVQELRDLVQGGIQPASSTLATALGLKDKDIEAAKESSEGLFKFLMKRLNGFKEASDYTQTTLAGRLDQVKEGIQRAGADGMSPLLSGAKDVLDDIAKKMFVVNETTKKTELNPDFVESIRSASNTAMDFARDMKEIGQVLGTVVVPAAKAGGEAIAFAATHTKEIVAMVGGWVALRQVAGIYLDVAAAVNGAATAQTFLGQQVLITRAQQEAAAAEAIVAVERQALTTIATGSTIETAAVAAVLGQERVSAAILQTTAAREGDSLAAVENGRVISAITTAAQLGQYELAQAVIATSMTYEQQSATAALMVEQVNTATMLARAGQLELAQAVLATTVTFQEQSASAVVAGEREVVAAGAAADAQRGLAGSIGLTAAAHVEAGAAAGAASAAQVTGAAVAMTAVESLTATVWALVGGWLGVAAATTYAIYKLHEYMAEKNAMDIAEARANKEAPRYTMLPVEDGGLWYDSGGHKAEEWKNDAVSDQRKQQDSGSYWSEYERQQRQKSADDRKKELADNPPDLSLKFPPAAKVDKGAGKKAEQAYEEAQRLNDKIQDMLAKMDEKIMAETGTAFEVNNKKLTDEVANMKRELDKSAIDFAKYGISTESVLSKIVEYQDTIAAKNEKLRARAMSGMVAETHKAQAEYAGDPAAEAKAEYEATLLKLEKEKENRLKEVARSKNDAAAKLAVDEWYNSQVQLAEQKRQASGREGQIREFNMVVEHNNLLLEMNQASVEQTDVLNRQSLNAKLAYLDSELSYAKLTKEERVKIEREKADTIKDINKTLAKDMKTALPIAIKEMQKMRNDWVEEYKSSFGNVDSAFESHIAKMLSLEESLSDGIIGIVQDMARELTRMMAKMVYEQAIMQPVRQWWGNILGGLFGGGGGSGGGSSGGGIGGGTYNDGGISFDGACATGGPVMAGRVYRVNELGIEAFQPAVDGYILNHGQTRSAFGNSSSATAPPSVQVNITNNTSTAIQEPQVTTRYDEDQRKFVVGVIIDAVNNNTAARNAVRKAANG